MERRPGGEPDGAEERDGALFDRYLAAVLEGHVEDPERFFARHPGAGEDVRGRVRAVHALHGGSEGENAERGTGDRGGLPWERLGEFRLLRRLSEGGMGMVFEARQESLGRVVALKIVRPEIRRSPTALARFEREAAVLARLRHPHVVAVHSFGTDDDVAYIAMERVPGRGLDEILRDAEQRGERLPAADVVRWGAEIARALECAHGAGVVHRDVKPGNVRITPEGRAVLIDFGVAHDARAEGLTATGPLVGSPIYAAPEQIVGGGVDARTDVYGLGATLYECLEGRPVVERGTVEQVIHRKVHTDPARLGRGRPRLARDLGMVVMKALERQPERRYATAGAFADDLEAVLGFRPVKARPPGLLRRAAAWARRRPGTAAALAAPVAAGLLAAVVLLVAARADASRRRADARELVAEAADEVRRLAAARELTLRLETDVRRMREELESRHVPEERLARLDAAEVEAARIGRERQESVHEVLELLRRAERLDEHVAGADAVRAALYYERSLEAETWADHESAVFFREKVLELDPEGPAAERLAAAGSVSVRSDPPGAELHLFRYVELRTLPGRTSPRQVPLPFRASDAPHAGRHGLRVVQGTEELPPETLIVAVGGEEVDDENHRRLRARVEAGGVAARIADADTGAEREVELPPGLSVRATAAPLLVGRDSLLGRSPLLDRELPPGPCLLLARTPGREDVRVFLPMATRVHLDLDFPLHPLRTTPPGWVRVVLLDVAREDIDVWMMEREVTSGEYLEFLRDPHTRAEVAAGRAPRLDPRGVGAESGYWTAGEDGSYALPADWPEDWPAIGVSHEAALAYAEWLTRRRPPPPGTRYSLPSHDEWVVAGGACPPSRDFVFGNAFRPQWCNSCFSRPQARVERVMGYPVDESPFGVFDMTGSAMEWNADWWDEARGLRRLTGGSWAQAKPDYFRLYAGVGLKPDHATGESGFRLVLRPVEDRR